MLQREPGYFPRGGCLQQPTPGDAGAPTPASTTTVPAAPASGRTDALLVWTRRDEPTEAVDVVVAVADPLGRKTQRTLALAAWVEPAPDRTLEIIDVCTIVGRGTVANLVTVPTPPTSRRTRCPWSRRSRGLVFPFLPVPPRPPFSPQQPAPDLPPGGGGVGPSRRRARFLRASWGQGDIRERLSSAPPRARSLQAVRSRGRDVTAIGLGIPRWTSPNGR